ncbi:glutaredoxin-like protein NrdH [Plantibacter sp. Mn2098]|uniref:glutaredoxin-like protein NrdH n=1 Tax=Plantibacter sp. Mn2098 TaxID=3395266 RepID=UPI003BE254BF
MITIYSKPNCQQCRMTYLALDRRGIAYEVVNVAAPENADALVYVSEELGYSTAPVVVVDDQDHWGGFRPDRIAAIEILP